MTVCIASLCDNRQSVVLIADRMVSTGLAIEFEHPVSNKVTTLSPNCVALTAGNALVYSELFSVVRSRIFNRRSTTAEELVEIIKGAYQELRERQIVERVLRPMAFSNFREFYSTEAMLSDTAKISIINQIERFDYGLDILVGGITPGGPAHLYAIEDPGTSMCYDSIGFNVIGSGMNLAFSSLIANHCHEKMNLSDSLMLALEAKITAENAPGVGRKTDVVTITSEGAAFFTDNNVRRLIVLNTRRKNGDPAYKTEIPRMITAILSDRSGIPTAEKATIMPEEQHDGNSGKQHGESTSDSENTESDDTSGDQDRPSEEGAGGGNPPVSG
ncbi:MAG: hypothetical protein IID44_08865 [Planctomycetes bacterium]|nr:hypothetical protein [Planctomycetota bacterium]